MEPRTTANPPTDKPTSYPILGNRTQQQFLQDCDINVIIARYHKTGVLPERAGQPFFGNFTNGTDFTERQNEIAEANAAFNMLPGWVRKRFQNNPANLLQFLSDEENRDEAIKLGLINKPVKTPEGPTPAEDAKTEKVPVPS
nr:MAG: internal scaffolding protein [Microviridae sp.]